jgi:hypothetical protein
MLRVAMDSATNIGIPSGNKAGAEQIQVAPRYQRLATAEMLCRLFLFLQSCTAFSKWRIAMHKLDLRGHLLYLKGGKQTLELAQAHNTRNIPIELEAFHHIDPSKVHLNRELVL